MFRAALFIGSAPLFALGCSPAIPTKEPASEVQTVTAGHAHPITAGQHEFAETERRLRQALETRDLTLFTVVDHGAGAASVGSDIGQSKLFIFGNPKAGTPLMVSDRQLGLDLPLKILLAAEDDGVTSISYVDISTVLGRHDVDAETRVKGEKIMGNLSGIVSEIR